MILDYRAFDTFGESCVLYIAAVVVMAALKQQKIRLRKYKKRDMLLSQVAVYFVPVIFLFGIYIILNGHLSPGGGFAGGAIISAGMILYANAFGTQAAAKVFNDRTYVLSIVSALGFYCCAKAYSFFYRGESPGEWHTDRHTGEYSERGTDPSSEYMCGYYGSGNHVFVLFPVQKRRI